MDKRLKILAVSPFDIYPPDYGGAIGIYYRLKYLKERGHSVFCVLPEPDDPSIREFLKKDFDGFFFVSKKRKLNSLLSFIKGESSYYSAKFTPVEDGVQLLNDFIYSASPDIFLMEGTHCIGIYYSALKSAIEKLHAAAVHYSHNIEYKFSYNNYKDMRCDSIWKIINYINFLRLRKAEPEYFKEFRLIFSISEDEAEIIKNLSPDSDVEWIPPVFPNVQDGNSRNGNSDYDFSELKSAYDHIIVFIGHLGSAHNVRAVKWFSEKVFTLINTYDGKRICFVMVGKNPAKVVLDIAGKNKNIYLYPNVLSVAPFMQLADLVVIPIFNDAGIKIKLIEALKYGKKVVARPEALNGSGLKGVVPSGRTPEEFAAACINVLYGQIEYKSVLAKFNEIYNNDIIIDKMEKSFYGLINEKEERRV